MRNTVIKIPKSPLCIMLANGNGYGKSYKDIPILLTQDNCDFLSQIIDTAFYVQLSKGTAYAKTAKCINGKTLIYLMHRLLTNCPENMVVDHHPNHYGLDNRYGEDKNENNLTNVAPIENYLNKTSYYSLNEFAFPFFPKLTDPDNLEKVEEDIERIKNLNLLLKK